MEKSSNNAGLEWLSDIATKLKVEAHSEQYVLQHLLNSEPQFKEFYEAERRKITGPVVWWKRSKSVRECDGPVTGHAVAKHLKLPAGCSWTITLERIPALLIDAPQVATELAIIRVSQENMASIEDFIHGKTIRHAWVIEQAVLEIRAAHILSQYGIKRNKIRNNPFGHSVSAYEQWPEGLKNLLVFECFRQIMLYQIATGYDSIAECVSTNGQLSAIFTDIETIRKQYPSILKQAQELVECAKNSGLGTMRDQVEFYQEIVKIYGQENKRLTGDVNRPNDPDQSRQGLRLDFSEPDYETLTPVVVFNGTIIESCDSISGLCYPPEERHWWFPSEEIADLIKGLFHGMETHISLYNRSNVAYWCNCDAGLTFLPRSKSLERARVVLWQDYFSPTSARSGWPPGCKGAYDTIVFAREPIEMDSEGHRIRDSAEIDIDQLVSQIVGALFENFQKATSERRLEWDDWFLGLVEIYEDSLGHAYLKKLGLTLHYRTEGNRRIAHCEDGPCATFCNDHELWALNGVIVGPELVVTPGDKLDPAMLLNEPNAEVRREIVRKIGIERVCAELGAAVIDSDCGYQLLELDLRDGRRRPYLKMKNPSTEAWHIEGVHPDCTTVREALAWRNWTSEFPVKVT